MSARLHATCKRLGLFVGKGMGAKATLFHAHVMQKMEEGDCTVRRGEPGFGGIVSIEISLDRLESFSRTILDAETTWPMHLLLKSQSGPSKRCMRQAIKRFGFRVQSTVGTLKLVWSEALWKAQHEQRLKCRRGVDMVHRLGEALRKVERESVVYERATERPNVPNVFLCPITMAVMQNPVVAADGQTYEEHAILRWMSTRRTSPITNKHLQSTETFPNFLLRSMIREWLFA